MGHEGKGRMIAEGLAVLHHANIGKLQHEVDAETTSLRDPQYDFNLPDITDVWRRGSVIEHAPVRGGPETLAGMLSTCFNRAFTRRSPRR